ncbi:hypothetical protein CALCODRAFT_484125 [Calocera cornea HHB12733]|uniref:Uncharacterized protein n=1 Tax=Calocera cornea HHB12733 TaxID=1353952 RepID=A0A165F597_9BASI|nr:hypothetical protein CALCODRAFT_484125 [Calocera cornea HHB12733]
MAPDKNAESAAFSGAVSAHLPHQQLVAVPAFRNPTDQNATNKTTTGDEQLNHPSTSRLRALSMSGPAATKNGADFDTQYPLSTHVGSVSDVTWHTNEVSVAGAHLDGLRQAAVRSGDSEALAHISGTPPRYVLGVVEQGIVENDLRPPPYQGPEITVQTREYVDMKDHATMYGVNTSPVHIPISPSTDAFEAASIDCRPPMPFGLMTPEEYATVKRAKAEAAARRRQHLLGRRSSSSHDYQLVPEDDSEQLMESTDQSLRSSSWNFCWAWLTSEDDADNESERVDTEEERKKTKTKKKTKAQQITEPRFQDLDDEDDADQLPDAVKTWIMAALMRSFWSVMGVERFTRIPEYSKAKKSAGNTSTLIPDFNKSIDSKNNLRMRKEVVKRVWEEAQQTRDRNVLTDQNVKLITKERLNDLLRTVTWRSMHRAWKAQTVPSLQNKTQQNNKKRRRDKRRAAKLELRLGACAAFENIHQWNPSELLTEDIMSDEYSSSGEGDDEAKARQWREILAKQAGVKSWLTGKLEESGDSGSQNHLWACWIDRFLFAAPKTKENKDDVITKEGYIFTPLTSRHPFLPLTPAASPPSPITTSINDDDLAPPSPEDAAQLQAKEKAADLKDLMTAFDLQRGEGATGGPKKTKTVGDLLEDEVTFLNTDFAVTHFLSSFLAYTVRYFAPASINEVLIWLGILLKWCTLAPEKRLQKDAFSNVISVSLVKQQGEDTVIDIWPDLRTTGVNMLPCGASNPPRKGGPPQSIQGQAKVATQREYCLRLAELITPKRVTWIIRSVTALVWYGAFGETFQGLRVQTGNCIPPGNCGEACFWLCLARDLFIIARDVLKKPSSWSNVEIHLVTLQAAYTRLKVDDFLRGDKGIDHLVSQLKKAPCAMSCCVCCRLVLTMIKDTFGDFMQGMKILHVDPSENEWVEVPTFNVEALDAWILEMKKKHGDIPPNWREKYDETVEKRKDAVNKHPAEGGSAPATTADGP